MLAVRQAGYRCKVTGRAFDIDFRTRGAGGTHYAPSPDRIVPELGYVRGNVRWILWCINRGKGEMLAEDYLEICRMVAGYLADDVAAPGEAHSAQPPYTRQQLAAFKAHVTMARRSLDGLTGDARMTAIGKLARYEARLATALAPREV